MTEQTFSETGSCLCGGVQYKVFGEMRPIIYCHCSQCRKTSGHFVAATACDAEDLVIVVDDTLQWYPSSQHAERGFCNRCGGNLFWRSTRHRHVSIMAGTMDLPTGLQATAHIHTADASDFRQFTDNLPRHTGGGLHDTDTA